MVLERGELNREASGTNAGSFHFQIAMHQLAGSDLGADRERCWLTSGFTPPLLRSGQRWRTSSAPTSACTSRVG